MAEKFIDYSNQSLENDNYKDNNSTIRDEIFEPVGVNIFGNANSINTTKDSIIDADWIATKFLVSNSLLSETLSSYKFYSPGSEKFTDSSIGGNIGINPRSQFTPYADIPLGSNKPGTSFPGVTDAVSDLGMGRYYSETIDDNQQILYLSFGVAKFNSLFDFFTKAVDYSDSVFANTGRMPTSYTAGKAIGNLVMLAAFPLITITVWAVKILSALVSNYGAFKYYYLNPMMHMYWSTVNSISTQIATELGILIPEFQAATASKQQIGLSLKINQEDLNAMKSIAPGLIGDQNYIDVFSIATKAQSVANAQAINLDKKYAVAKKTPTFSKYIKDRFNVNNTLASKLNHGSMFKTYLDKITRASSSYYYDRTSVGAVKNKKEISGEPVDNTKKKTDLKAEFKRDKSTGAYPAPEESVTASLTKFASAFDSTVRDGAMFAIFNVDYTGSASDSFGNSTEDIGTSEVLKSLSRKSRNLKFSFAGGDVFGDTVKAATNAVKDVANGVLDSVTYGLSNVVQTLIGGGYVDIEKIWSDSDMSLSSNSYSIQLISPYNNPISQMLNLYIPLSMLLAGTLPLATGKASYTSPFLCSAFSKGIQNIQLGMITSLSITRGTSNLGFDKNRKALAIDVNFTITNFSNIMSAPVNSSIFDDVYNVSLNDDSVIGQYVAMLGARNVLTNKYLMPKIKLKASRMVLGWEQATSAYSWGMRVGESFNGILGGLVSQRELIINH